MAAGRRPYNVFFQDADGHYQCEIVTAMSRNEADGLVRLRAGVLAVYGPNLPRELADTQRQLLNAARDRRRRQRDEARETQRQPQPEHPRDEEQPPEQPRDPQRDEEEH